MNTTPSSQNPSQLELWVEERHRDIVAQRYRVKNVLFSKKSAFQKIDVVETQGHGRMLLNDGLVMISERDEAIYHEMITHVPTLSHPDPKHILIIGGGDGGTLREVLKHPSVQTATVVEIDEIVVQACQKYIPQTAHAFKHPKARVLIEDGIDFVKRASKNTYDIILVDSTDPIGPAQPLFNELFYQHLKRILKPKGIVVSQAESPFYEIEMQKKLLSILKSCFSKVHLYNFSNLTYPGGIWSFSYATDQGSNPLTFPKQLCKSPDKKKRWNNLKKVSELFYYNPSIHAASFQLPSFQKKALKPFLTMLDESF